MAYSVVWCNGISYHFVVVGKLPTDFRGSKIIITFYIIDLCHSTVQLYCTHHNLSQKKKAVYPASLEMLPLIYCLVQCSTVVVVAVGVGSVETQIRPRRTLANTKLPPKTDSEVTPT